ncbi:MAG: helix-turn-helix domain-containing protein [Candidatus Bathyarchaeota archaeon]
MNKKILLSEEEKQQRGKEIFVFKNPQKLRMVLGKLSWEILSMLADSEMYPMEIAKKLGVHEQKVYYHIRKLAKAGAITVTREEEKKGATAKYYRVVSPAFGIELPFGYRSIKAASFTYMVKPLQQFFTPFVMEDRGFDGKIVVGSPDPHGSFKARARDGHYASYLALFLGQFVRLPTDFIVKLDVDVKAEKEENNNLVLVGGPGTNLLTQEINDHLPIRFSMMPSEHGFLFGGLVSQKTQNIYTGDAVGVVARIANPWNKERRIVVLAGNKAVGTKACVLAITRFWKQTLKGFRVKSDFAKVVQGFDLDGDGKVDSIEVIE